MDEPRDVAPGEPGSGGPDARDVAVALGLGILTLAVYLAAGQDATWSDGRLLPGLVERSTWTYHHVLFLPLARAVLALLRAVDGDVATRTALLFLSALAGAVAVAATYLAGRELRRDRAAALFGAGLLGLAPGAAFFSTTVEVHAPQLAAAALAAWWAARAARPGRLGERLTLPALLLCALVGTHMTGLAWAPSFGVLVLLWVRRLRARPAGATGLDAAATLAVLGAFAAWYQRTHGVTDVGGHHVLLGLQRLTRSWSASFFLSELVVPAGLTLPLAGVGAWLALRARGEGARGLLRPLPLATAVLLGAFLPFAFVVRILERGAYFVSLLPPAALLAGALPGWLARRAPGPGPRLLPAVLLAAQAGWAAQFWWSWERDYPGHGWIPTLVEETGGRALVLSPSQLEFGLIHHHTDLTVVLVLSKAERRRMSALLAPLLEVVDAAHEAGTPVALTRVLLESDDEVVEELRARLAARYGPPAPGRRPEYALLAR